MSYDKEGALLTKVMETREIKAVIRSRVTADFFSDFDHKQEWKWLVEQYERYGSCPSLDLFMEEFPEFVPVQVTDDLSMLVDRVKSKKLYTDLQLAMQEVITDTRDDPREGLNTFKTLALDLALKHTDGRDEDVTKTGDEVWEQYERIKKFEGTTGIPYPWPLLNTKTLGMHGGEIVWMYARPGSMKTWLLLYIMEHAHTEYGKVPIFFTKEMPVAQIRQRWAALRAKIDYEAFRAGKLTEKEEKAFKAKLEQLADDPPFIVTNIEETGPSAVAEVRAKAQEYRADLVAIDGGYLLADSEEWGAMVKVSRGLRQLALDLMVPVVGTTQRNRTRGRDDGADVAYSDALVQDADVLMRINRDGVQKENDELLLTFPKLREVRGCSLTVNALPAYDFSQKYVHEEDGGHHRGVDGGGDEGGIV